MWRSLAGLTALILGVGVGLHCGNPSDATPERVILLDMPDTAVTAGNSLCLYVLSRAPRRDTVVQYHWSCAHGRGFDTTTSTGLLCRQWMPEDSGANAVIVQAVTQSARSSESVVILVTVRVCAPSIDTVMADSVAWVGDTSEFRAVRSDSCTAAARYVWTFDDRATRPDTTTVPVARRIWALADTGAVCVAVRLIDAAGLASDEQSACAQVRYCRPVLALTVDPVVTVPDTLHASAALASCAADVAFFVWTFGNADPETTLVGECVLPRMALADTGTVVVRVHAEDIFGQASAQVQDTTLVTWCAPEIALTGDTLVSVGDTAVYGAWGSSCTGRIAAYVWTFGSARDSSEEGRHTWVWSFADTGRQTVTVRALNKFGVYSVLQTLHVRVTPRHPLVRLSGGAHFQLGDTAIFTAAVMQASAAVSRYEWTFVGTSSTSDTTAAGILLRRWSLADTGSVLVRVSAVDADGMRSEPDSLRVRVDYCRPRLRLMSDTVVYVNDTTTVIVRDSGGCTADLRLYWAVGNASGRRDTTRDARMMVLWTVADTGVVTICVTGRDQFGMEAVGDSTTVHVLVGAPTLTLPESTTVTINDTLLLQATLTRSTHAIARYVWAVDGQDFDRTTAGSRIRLAWPTAAYGRHIVRVKAVDSRGIESALDSTIVTVRLDAPWVEHLHDTTMSWTDSVRLTIHAHDSTGSIGKYFWSMGGFAWTDSSSDSVRVVRWTGRDTVRVVYGARDDDGLIALDSMHVYFSRSALAAPQVESMHDTLVSWTDSVRLTIRAHDPDGSINKYFWSVGGFAWTDSSSDSTHTVTWTGPDAVRVVYGARDNHGLVALDSMHVYFNRPPTGLRMARPVDNDTIVFGLCNGTYGQGAVGFLFGVQDPNGRLDSLTYSLRIGASPTVLDSAYRGRADSVRIAGLDTATYYWRLAVRDLYGDSTALTGSFTTLLRKTICFIGHSIVNGALGDAGQGGFRKGVIDGLRARSGSLARVQPVGPLTIGTLLPESDDSCLALDAAIAMSMAELFINSYPDLLADAYVIMLGVNWDYSPAEFGYILGMVNDMHRRTPDSAIYWVNGLPYPQSYWWAPHIRVKTFNRWVADTVASRQAQGWNIHLIDAFDALCVDTLRADTVGIVDTVRVDSLFGDDLHPNQRGYDVLSRLLLDSISVRW